jgi:hypothetical protein
MRSLGGDEPRTRKMSATLWKPSLNEAASTVEQRGRLSARTNFDL